jgi:ABC-type sugar transport system ATPase subunit
MNLVESLFDIEDGEGVCRFGSHQIRVPGSILSSHPRLVEIAGSAVGLGVRPEDITNGISDGQNEQTISSEVQRIEYLGSDTLIHITVDARGVSSISGESDRIKAGESRLANTKEKTTFVIRCDPKVPLQRGQVSTFTVNVERLHFFDLSSGIAI